jgi:hypothetical protein
MACSGIGVTNALSAGSRASMRERVSVMTSVAETSLRAMEALISSAVA